MKYEFNDGGRADAGYVGWTGDCVCRSIAIATGKPYQEVYDALISTKESMRQTKRVRGSHPRTGTGRNVYDRYLKSLGWTWHPTMTIGSGTKVHLKDGEIPMTGNLVVRVSKHMTAVVDGTVHDNHDCTRGGTRCVYGFYSKDK